MIGIIIILSASRFLLMIVPN